MTAADLRALIATVVDAMPKPVLQAQAEESVDFTVRYLHRHGYITEPADAAPGGEAA